MAGVQRYENASTTNGSKNKKREGSPSPRKDKKNGQHTMLIQ